MNRPALFAAFIVLLVALHLVMHVAFGWGRGAPDLLTVAALLAARRVAAPWAVGIGLVLGVLQDALSLTGFGASAIALAGLCYLGARSRDLFVGESVFFLAVYLFFGKWLRDVIVYLLGQDARAAVIEALLLVAPVAAFYAAVAGAVALAVYRGTRVERS